MSISPFGAKSHTPLFALPLAYMSERCSPFLALSRENLQCGRYMDEERPWAKAGSDDWGNTSQHKYDATAILR